MDFAACSVEIRNLFNDVSDLNRIFMRLQFEYGVELKERKSAIIFDEVQLAPKESGKHNYEVDFLIADGDKVSPIEVKSSGYMTHASLDAFCNKFSARIRNKYLIYTKDIRKGEDILCLPAYMTMFL